MLNTSISIFKTYPAILPQHVGDLYMLRGVALCKMNKFQEAMDDIILAGKLGQKLEVEMTKMCKFLTRVGKFVQSPPTNLTNLVGLFPPSDGTIKSFPTFWQEAKGFQYFPLSEDERHQLTEYYLLHLDANPTDSISEADSLINYLLATDNEGITLASQNSVFLYFLCLYWKKEGWVTEFAKVGEIWKGSKDNVDQEFWDSVASICNQAPVLKFMQ